MRFDYQDISDLMRQGASVPEFEDAAQVIDSFPHGRDDYLDTPWVTHAIDLASIEVVVWMLEQRVSVTFEADDGYSVLHSAIERNLADRHAIMEHLIAAGADLNVYGIHGWTPLHMAACKDDLKAAEILLKAGADPDRRTVIDDCTTPAEEAENLGHLKAAEFIRRFKSAPRHRGS